ncbi:hypothetical protein LOC68_07240 [Blastopirellula sp. JC732]|uniref:Uncharacterized protein n=1 Tax=Blastopirellula sediminis TaxID=2894196 RepID=A0A9X1ML28_9BACT|nr:hypothetical protein [Blastopirellula sediminis]MCC9609038.1 hypothetical protein [Blastopirellula sediminis]MCC9628185.1 hypothetical protein [Blastopirellula sediminis]
MADSKQVLAPTYSGSLAEFENSAYPDSFGQRFIPRQPTSRQKNTHPANKQEGWAVCAK